MSLTEEQKAYHLRKMKTRYERMDIDKNGYLSREDHQLMGERLIEKSSGITSEQADNIRKKILILADTLGFKDGVKIPLKEAAKNASEIILSMNYKDKHAMIRFTIGPLFDAIDTNDNGIISVNEFKVYLHAMVPDISDADTKRSFDAIDADKNGKINREEFLAAMTDFLVGVEKTEISETYMGPLL